MKRLVTLVIVAGFIISSLVATGQSVWATPFSDVPANSWAYQAIPIPRRRRFGRGLSRRQVQGATGP